MLSPDRLWLAGPLGVLYLPIMVTLTILWYMVIVSSLSALKTGKQPAYLWHTVFCLAVFMVVTRSAWVGSLPRIIGAAFTFWAMSNGTGPMANLTPSLRLKFCSNQSVGFCGTMAALAVGIVIVLLRLPDNDGTLTLGKMGVVFSMAMCVGYFAGLLRKKLRQRWPEAVESGFTSIYGTMSGGAFYIDELIMPVVFTPFVWAILLYSDYIWSAVFGFSFMAPPVMILFAIPVYALWAWFHTGLLGWLGQVNTGTYMEFEAFQALLYDDSIQRWLGEVKIAINPSENRYVLSGSLPDRLTLSSFRIRLHDINNAEVDTSGVTIDPSMQPDFRKLTAIVRRTPRRRLAISK